MSPANSASAFGAGWSKMQGPARSRLLVVIPREWSEALDRLDLDYFPAFLSEFRSDAPADDAVFGHHSTRDDVFVCAAGENSINLPKIARMGLRMLLELRKVRR